MGPVLVDENTGAVGVVVGVATDMGALVDDEAGAPELGAEAFCKDETGEAGSDDEVVVGQGARSGGFSGMLPPLVVSGNLVLRMPTRWRV